MLTTHPRWHLGYFDGLGVSPMTSPSSLIPNTYPLRHANPHRNAACKSTWIDEHLNAHAHTCAHACQHMHELKHTNQTKHKPTHMSSSSPLRLLSCNVAKHVSRSTTKNAKLCDLNHLKAEQWHQCAAVRTQLHCCNLGSQVADFNKCQHLLCHFPRHAPLP